MPVVVGLARAACAARACRLVLVAGCDFDGHRCCASGDQVGPCHQTRGVLALSGTALVSGRADAAGGVAAGFELERVKATMFTGQALLLTSGDQ